jgi:hypothetical protein
MGSEVRMASAVLVKRTGPAPARHWIPLFVTPAALATLTCGRWIVLTLAAILAVTAGIHNAEQLKATLALPVSNTT